MTLIFSFPRFSMWLRAVALSGIAMAGIASRGMALEASNAKAIRVNLAQGEADDAIRRLTQALTGNPQDAEAHNLLCRVYFQEQRWDNAVHECEQAARLAPESGVNHLWLGRIYGEKADHASYFEGYGLSKKIRSEFETAVKLEPRNVEALADLAQFYTEAPSIVGGGTDKAAAIVARVEPLDLSRAHELRGRMASQQKNYAQAESEFKAAIASAKAPAGPWTALASSYRKQQRWDDMLHAIREAVSADREHGVALTYAASLLIRSDREPELAIRLLRQYLASPNKSEDAPAFQIHARLGQVLLKQGDRQGAQHEFDAAKAMARDYRVPSQSGGKTG
jgi:tetratricopeptide (TPR) repeat protein